MVEGTTRTTNLSLESLLVPTTAVFVVLAAFWLSLLSSGWLAVGRVPAGVVFVLFVPGYLVVRAARWRTERPAILVVQSVAFSAVVVTLVVLVTPAVSASLGAERTLDAVHVAGTLTVVVLGLFALAYHRTTAPPAIELTHEHVRASALAVVPAFGVAAALAMRYFETNVGSYAFVLGLAALVVGVWWTRPSTTIRAATVWATSAGLLLHRNLASPYVVGADVQWLVAVADAVHATGTLEPALSGTAASIPLVTAFPATVATLLDAPLVPTFKLLFVFVFSLVPVGVYAVGSKTFGPDVAYPGALFFALYHLSFQFTPGKQLVSELFAVLVLYYLVAVDDRDGRTVVVAVGFVGVVLTHYGTTLLFGGALLFASGALWTRRRLFGHGPRLSVVYPVALLVGAVAWYAVASWTLVRRIVMIPLDVAEQLVILLSGVPIEQSGAATLASSTTLLDTLNVVLYALIAAIAGIGLFWLAWTTTRDGADADSTHTTYFAIAVPVFAFLGMAYFFVLDLWVERVYQLSLVVLAPLVPLGVAAGRNLISRIPAMPGVEVDSSIVPVLLVVLLAFSSGFAPAVAGQASVSTFDPDANDLAFDDEDLAAVECLRSAAGIERVQQDDSSSGSVLRVDQPGRVQVYADAASYQLLRSSISPAFYNTELVILKNRFQPELAPWVIEDGYVFVREEAVLDDPSATSARALTPAEVRTLRDAGTVVYDREGTVVLAVGDVDTTSTALCGGV